MTKRILPASALALALAPIPATANPAVGLGLSFTFGKSGPDVGVGVRVFSDNEQDKTVAAAGLDYMFKSKGLRASVGAAKLKDGSYMELNGGYNFKNQSFDIGLGGGVVETESNDSTSELTACPLCGLYVCNCVRL